MIPIAKPHIGEDEKRAVMEVLDSGLLVQGERVREFERSFAGYHGIGHGIATSSGTTALITALMAHGIGPGDQVVVPAFTFFATASAVLSVGAKPVFADVDARTLTLGADQVARVLTPQTRAVIAVHLYGCLADMPRLAALCAQHGLILLEDAAQAHGAKLGVHGVGSWGTACFSFHPSKNMTTGEGGMVLTNEERIADLSRQIRNQGMTQRYHHERPGSNFRLTECAAAIGLAQLQRLDAWTHRRIANAARYHQGLRGVQRLEPPAGVTHVYHQYTVRLPGGRTASGRSRDDLVCTLQERQIDARVYYRVPLHRQPCFAALNCAPYHLPSTERAAEEVFSLPVHPGVSELELDFIIDEVNRLCA